MRNAFLSLIVVLGLITASVPAEQEKRTPRLQSQRGQITKIDGTSMTVTTRGDSGERQYPFTLSDSTKVLVETTEDVKVKIKGEGGEREVVRPKTVEAKVADLKVGQTVTVTHLEGKAQQVQVHRPVVRKKEGER